MLRRVCDGDRSRRLLERRGEVLRLWLLLRLELFFLRFGERLLLPSLALSLLRFRLELPFLRSLPSCLPTDSALPDGSCSCHSGAGPTV